MVSKLDKDIDHLPLESSYLPLSSCSQLDSAGTELWNACSRLMRLDCEWKKENSRLLVKGLYLLYYIDCGILKKANLVELSLFSEGSRVLAGAKCGVK